MEAEIPSKKIVEECLKQILLERFGENFELSVAQRKCILSFVNNMQDTLGVMPTGHGKTLVYQLSPLLICQLNSLGYKKYPENPIILVVSPLKYLIIRTSRKMF